MFDMDFTGCLNDDAFGPSVLGCRGDFDFTLQFEKIFLSIIPSSIFVALALTRTAILVRKPTIVKGTAFKYTKLVRLPVNRPARKGRASMPGLLTHTPRVPLPSMPPSSLLF
jgi:hypothetical protein